MLHASRNITDLTIKRKNKLLKKARPLIKFQETQVTTMASRVPKFTSKLFK